MMTMPEAMKEATYSLHQSGVKMCTYDVKHLPPIRNMTNAYDTHARAFFRYFDLILEFKSSRAGFNYP